MAALVAAAIAIVLATGGHSGGPSGRARGNGNPGILGSTTVPATTGDRSVSPTTGLGTSTTRPSTINPGGVQITTPPPGRSSVPDSDGQVGTDPGSLVGNGTLAGNR